MKIKLVCPCGQGFVAKQRLAGRTLKCPKCGRRLKIPEPKQAAQPQEAAADLSAPPSDQTDAAEGLRTASSAVAVDGQRGRAYQLLMLVVLILIVVYVFLIFLLGLAGASLLGGWLDLAFSFVNEEWVGRGRHAGWLLGAVLTAIVAPVRCIRAAKKRGFPLNPAKWSKEISLHLAKQKEEKDEKTDRKATRPKGVFKIGGISGLVGLFCGIAIGGALLMMWFSVSMSPFAPSGWSESIRVEAGTETPSGERRGGTTLTTQHPLALWLFLSPVVVLSTVGLLGGTIGAAVAGARRRRSDRASGPTEVS